MAHQPTFLLWNLAHFRDIDGNKQKCLGWQSRETRLDSIENVKWTTSDLEKKLDLATASFNWFSHTCCLQYLLDLKKSLKVHRNSLVLVADKLFLMNKTTYFVDDNQGKMIMYAIASVAWQSWLCWSFARGAHVSPAQLLVISACYTKYFQHPDKK